MRELVYKLGAPNQCFASKKAYHVLVWCDFSMKKGVQNFLHSSLGVCGNEQRGRVACVSGHESRWLHVFWRSFHLPSVFTFI